MNYSTVWKISIFSALLVISSFTLKAQEFQSWYVDPGIENIRYQGELFTSEDDKLIFIGSAFYQPAQDSGYVAIVKMDHDGTILAHREYSLFGLSIFYDAIQVPGGYIISGKRVAGVDTPYLIKIANDLTIEWSKFPGDSDILSEQFIAMVLADSQINIFSSRNPGQNFSHLIRTDLSGENWEQVTTNAVDGSDMRVFEAVSTGNPGQFMVLGQIEDSQTGDDESLIMLYDGDNVMWSKRIHFESGDVGNPSDIIRLNDGNFIFSYLNFSTLTTSNTGYISKIDMDGTLLWSKSYARSGIGFLLGKPVEMANGNILIPGIDGNTFTPNLLKLDSEGNIIWVKEWSSDAPGALGIMDLLPMDDGTYRLMTGGNQIGITELNALGEGCTLTNGDPVIVNSFVPNMTPFDFGNLVASTTEGDLPYFDRSYTYGSETQCSIVISVDEASENHLTLSPNPAHDFIRIDGLRSLNELSYEIIGLRGNVQLEGRTSERIDLSHLDKGIWIAKLWDSNWSKTYRILKL